MSPGCYEGLPAEAQQALQDAEALRRRLVRLVQALALGSELAADVLRSAAQSGEVRAGQADQMLLLSKESDEHAELYRLFERQLSHQSR